MSPVKMEHLLAVAVTSRPAYKAAGPEGGTAQGFVH